MHREDSIWVLRTRQGNADILTPGTAPWGAQGRPQDPKTLPADSRSDKEARWSKAATSNVRADKSLQKCQEKNTLCVPMLCGNSRTKNPYIWACQEPERRRKEKRPTGKTYPVAYSSKYKLTDSSTDLCMNDSLRHVCAVRLADRLTGLKGKIPFHQMVKNRADSRANQKGKIPLHQMVKNRVGAGRGEKGEKETGSACLTKRKSSKPRPTNVEGNTPREEKPQTLESSVSGHPKGTEQGAKVWEKAVFRPKLEHRDGSVLVVQQKKEELVVRRRRPRRKRGESLLAVHQENRDESVLRSRSKEERSSLLVVHREWPRRRRGKSLLVVHEESALPPIRGKLFGYLVSRLSLLLLAILLSTLCAEKTRPATPLCPLMPREGIEALAQSIDRSRKRHLEEGLLRGDQVLDRLRVQEASASPLLKKTRKSPDTTPPRGNNMAMTMAEFKEYMDSNTNKRLGDIDNKIGGMQAAISDNTVKLDKHEAQISEIRSELVKMKSDFPPLPSATSPCLAPPPSAAMLPMPQPDEEYLKARRSLRLWPVRGPDLWKATGTFLVSNLGLEGKIDNDSVEDVSRVQLPSGPGVTDEVLVRFRTAVLRDLVMGSASRLGTFIDRDGRATAGMRMEVPTKLQQSFRVLFKYGSNLRARHGPGTRRHVKFCDTDHTLYLNVKLPGDDSWSRVSLQVAIRGMRARETINDGQLERRLDITGPFQDARRRATSVTAPPKPTEASAWTRRAGSSTSS